MGIKPGLYLVQGPPASGKTAWALEWARALLVEKRRVYWVGLPHQRAQVLARLGQGGGALGLEYTLFQGLYYQVLARARRLKPLVNGAARVALVAEALLEEEGRVGPGLARLFARAIAELKRLGLGPEDLPQEGEAGRLARVYRAYEALKGPAWDYDDFRREALGHSLPPGAALAVDGFRELTSPLELRFLLGVAREAPVLLTLEVLPPWWDRVYGEAGGDGVLRERVRLEAKAPTWRLWAFPNAVEAARYALAHLKRALLEEGLGLGEVYLVAPEDRIPGLLRLGEEYGLPLEDGRYRGLGETEAGERLLALLHPRPSGGEVLAVAWPEAVLPLGLRALKEGLLGEEALGGLAREMGLEAAWRAFLDLRAPRPGEDPLAWGGRVLGALGVEPKEAYLEALRLALKASPDPGEAPAWWRSHLLEARFPPAYPRGIPVLPPGLALGVRARRVYLLDWALGRYTLGEGEDYFLSEEEREALGLPPRLRGLDLLLWQELAHRGEEVYLLYPQADLGEDLRPIPYPQGVWGPPPPLGGGRVQEVPLSPPLVLRTPPRAWSLEGLRWLAPGSKACPFRARLHEAGVSTWRGERRRKGWGMWFQDREALLKDPRVRAWYLKHKARLEALTPREIPTKPPLKPFTVRVQEEGGRFHLYLFLPPRAEARLDPDRDWKEAGAALALGRAAPVEVWAWPWLEDPVPLPPEEWRGALEKVRDQVALLWSQLETLVQAGFAPRPGQACRTCALEDVCRKGA